jgi:ParB-like chromosome segregation protein Spo0J
LEPGTIDIEEQLVVKVDIDQLSVMDSPRSMGEDPDHVAALLVADSTLPPIIVHRPTMRVIDGRHRLTAAKILGRHKIAAIFFDGDDADAFVLAVKTNVIHGLPLTLADRKRAAGRILTSHPHWSDRMIASVSGVSPRTVADFRSRTADVEVIEENRVGQDGRVRPINSAEGRRRASEIIKANPDYSLRRIAREVGISPETARDVKNRLLRGEDPVPPRRLSRGRGGTEATPDRGKNNDREAPADRVSKLNPGAVVERLRADPSLRSSEKGRALLRLLSLHAATAGAWDELIESVPTHCGPIVAYLAGDFAQRWSELATRVELNVADTG